MNIFCCSTFAYFFSSIPDGTANMLRCSYDSTCSSRYSR